MERGDQKGKMMNRYHWITVIIGMAQVYMFLCICFEGKWEYIWKIALFTPVMVFFEILGSKENIRRTIRERHRFEDRERFINMMNRRSLNGDDIYEE
jgi:hypothetical protein